jgi:two-component system, response regulator
MNVPPAKTPLILLVEDSCDDELLTLRALDRSGLVNEVEVARDGAEAFDRLLGPDSGARPVPMLVLLDINLPKVSGIEVLRAVRDDPRTSQLPVVMLTTSAADRDVASSYELRANSYIQKPVDPKEFLDAIHTIGLYWLVFNHPPPVRSDPQS